MDLNAYLNKHLIICGGIRIQKFIYSDLIVDNPEEFIFLLSKTNYYISHICWWDYVRVGTISAIGYGGTRDPRDSNYYFAETDLCRNFGSVTTIEEYYNYLFKIKEIYSNYSIFPAFDIKKKE